MIGARILIADDEPVNRAVVRRVLEPLGCAVTEAADGREALNAVNRETPDLILLDVRMPLLDGYSVLRSLKTDPRTRLVPVIMLTALDQLSDKLAAIEIGADEYLAKPFSLQELQTRVRSLLSLKRFTDELEHASHVLEGIAHVVESRDRHTGNHCRRLGEYAARVGRWLGLGENEIKLLRLGGVFHDLGKIAVSDTILNKPAKLTPEEFDLMKSHPVTGFDLCREMKTMEKVLPLIRHHHEKLDGSGYPDHLKGDEIPLLVRIISVVDVFDALASKRSYKESLPQARCLEILRDETAKGWWDRDVVETLVKVLSSGDAPAPAP